MKQLIRNSIFVAALLLAVSANAQNGYTQYRLEGVHQSSALNPAFSPDAKVHIGLPALSGVDLRAAHDGFSLSDAIRIRPDDSLEVDVDGMIGALNGRNMVSVDARIELFSLGIGGDRGYFSFGITERMHLRMGYPRDLPVLAWEGNGKTLLGERASFDDFIADFTAFRQFSVGYSYRLTDRLTGGMRVSFLQGHFNTFTRTSRFGMHTDATTYNLTFDGEGEVNTSGFAALLDNEDPNFRELFFGPANRGFSADFGVNWDVNDRVQLSASLLDLGSIHWKRDTRSYAVDAFTYEFQGVDVNQALIDSLNTFDEVLDSLERIVTSREVEGSYRTPLNPRFFLSGSFKFNDKLSMGALLHGEVVRGRILPTAAVSFDARLSRLFSATVNYAYANRSWKNVGAGFQFHPGPVQFYLVVDNVLAPFIPDQVRGAQAMFGINIAVGRRDTKL